MYLVKSQVLEERKCWRVDVQAPFNDFATGEGAEGELRAKRKLTPHNRPPQDRRCVTFLRPSRRPKDKGKGKNKWPTDRDHSSLSLQLS